ncbi:hypothetical protein MPSEU_000672800 [Mayamaea pseudoterrestris]|nr:hypothetical protein MPSEU_000672800 [Mayamaea pseudoterrestris]
MSTTSTTIDDTNNKYDRQLRLWGAAGQRRLGETCVLLVGASACGTEAVKNLVLPGVGSVYILDDVIATTADQASNFFVVVNDDNEEQEQQRMQDDTASDAAAAANQDVSMTDSSTHFNSRARIAMQLLQELNPDVCGYYQHVESLDAFDYASLLRSLLQTQQQSMQSLTGATRTNYAIVNSINNLLVIASDLPPSVALSIARACHTVQIPLLSLQSYGLVGVVRLQSPPLALLHGAAANQQQASDLRLTNPFHKMMQLYKNIDWDSLDDYSHQHVPYPLILLHALETWRNNSKTTHESGISSHASSSSLPSTPDEKKDFVEIIKRASRNYDKELNYQQAVQFCHFCYASAATQTELPHEHLQQLLAKLPATNDDAGAAESVNSSSCKLRVIVLALLEFGKLHYNQAPLHGGIPDMASSTSMYVQLQNAYREQAQADLREVRQILQQQQQQQQQQQEQQEGGAAIIVSDGELVAACRNVHTLDLLSPGSIFDEYVSTSIPNSILQGLLEAATDAAEDDERPDQCPLLWYLGVQACRLFHDQVGRYPGTIGLENTNDNDDGSGNDQAYLQDVPLLQECLASMVGRYQLSDNKLVQETLVARSVDYATELTRWANAELHTIASVVGGVASQEAVKLITGQYVPIDDCYVYNGIASVAGVYKF